MKITIETPKPGEGDEIIIRCNSLDERLLNLIYSLKTEQDELTGYTANGVYEIHKKLYELEDQYGNSDFMRVSKSSIVNLAKIAYIRSIFNGRFEAKLKNNEKMIISRQYVADLKKKLEI